MPHRLRKTRWYRGSRVHGWGRVGQHRKSGGRGGYGLAGLKKHKRFYLMKYMPNHLGKHGFKTIYPRRRSINVGDLERFIKKGISEIDLSSLGYDKLLAKGYINKPVKVIVREASERAIKKIEAVGGKVSLTK